MSALLSVRGMFWIYFVAMVLTSVSGISIGLIISALVPEGKTAGYVGLYMASQNGTAVSTTDSRKPIR